VSTFFDYFVMWSMHLDVQKFDWFDITFIRLEHAMNFPSIEDLK
jgi:hypothetical protein